MYICTSYGNNHLEPKVLIVSPHGSDGKTFFKRFPEIYDHEEIKKKRYAFDQYVQIEQDTGAGELAHSIGQYLQDQNISNLVFEMDYPRAIVDGGRVKEHCLRNILPFDLSQHLEGRFRDMHNEALSKIEELHDHINDCNGIVLDIHTMASFSPVQNGTVATFSESFENMEAYCQQFINAPKDAKNQRYFDVITGDGEGNMIAAPELRDSIIKELLAQNIEYRENDPYSAFPAFLMNTHLNNCQAIALDVPKHMISTAGSPSQFRIEDFKIDFKRVNDLAQIIAKAAIQVLP